jgi:signal peptidase I
VSTHIQRGLTVGASTSESAVDRKVSTRRLMIGTAVLIPLIVIWGQFLSGEYRSFKVVSGSMIPTMNVGDFVLMARNGHMAELRDKAVVFQDPKHRDELLTKRVVAESGDTVRVVDGRIYVNNSREPMWRQPVHVANREWRVGRDQVFVVGDNRNNSFDSIDYGPIPKDLILGVVTVRYWPFTRLGNID